MDFALNASQQAIVDNVERLCAAFDLDYWRRKDSEGAFPHDFHAAIARAGYLGIAMPVQYGGAGLGMTEAVLVVPEQRGRWLPPLIRGEHKACFGVTEPNIGLNTLKLKTIAVRDGDHYIVSGQKIWISTAQVADKILLLARTTPIEQPARPSEGLTLFYADLDRSCIEVREIDKLGRACVDSNQLFIDGLRIPVADRVGDEGHGFACILHGFNPERMLIAAEAVGLGRAAIKLAARYANERIVFDRPIGKNQAIQHPLAHDGVGRA